MMKKLSILLILLVTLCTTALAGSHPIALRLGQEEHPLADRLTTEEGRAALIEEVIENIRRDSTFTVSYQGFSIEAAQETACIGIDGQGDIFVAMMNEKTGVMLSVVFDRATCTGEYTIAGSAQEAFAAFQGMALTGEVPLETIKQRLAGAPAAGVSKQPIPDKITMEVFQKACNSVWAYATEPGAVVWYRSEENPGRIDLYYKDVLWIASIFTDGTYVQTVVIVHEFAQNTEAFNTGVSNFRLMTRNAIASLLAAGGTPVMESVALANADADRLMQEAMTGHTQSQSLLYGKPFSLRFGPLSTKVATFRMEFQYQVMPAEENQP